MRTSRSRRLLEHLHTLACLWEHPWTSRRRLIRFRDRKLRFLIHHAYANVPFYRRRFEAAGVRPEDIRSAADLARLPLTAKQEVRTAAAQEILARGIDEKRLVLHYTTGSTGEPARVRRTKVEEHLLQMFRVRALGMLGRRVRDRSAKVRSSGVPTDRRSWDGRSLQDRLGIFPWREVSCLQPIEAMARELAQYAPDVLSGYAGVLTEVAALWGRMPGERPGPRLVFTGGEVLTPAMRAAIRDGFRAPVFDIYGSHEFNLLAWECAETGAYHVCDDNVIVEVIKDGRPAAPGESGELVATGLHSYAAPFIRYSLGDIVTLEAETCRCGLPFQTIREVRGRTMDYCVLPDGRKMHHWELIPMSFWDMPWHRRYQLVQQATDCFVLFVIPTQPPPEGDLERLQAAVMEKAGQNVNFQVECVSEILFGEGGKHRLCRSEIGRGGGA
ncbi:MAG: phenylacetate--CoA ligase family protein [Bryobacteraceae bacterium]|nr:phenylacetate--CoA ligase family protein [Bryobacteraceae bacterium]